MAGALNLQRPVQRASKVPGAGLGNTGVFQSLYAHIWQASLFLAVPEPCLRRQFCDQLANLAVDLQLVAFLVVLTGAHG